MTPAKIWSGREQGIQFNIKVGFRIIWKMFADFSPTKNQPIEADDISSLISPLQKESQPWTWSYLPGKHTRQRQIRKRRIYRRPVCFVFQFNFLRCLSYHIPLAMILVGSQFNEFPEGYLDKRLVFTFSRPDCSNISQPFKKFNISSLSIKRSARYSNKQKRETDWDSSLLSHLRLPAKWTCLFVPGLWSIFRWSREVRRTRLTFVRGSWKKGRFLAVAPSARDHP